MISLTRADSTNKDFIELVKFLDADLLVRDGKDQSFYAQFNKIDMIKNVVVAYYNNSPAGCGAIKPYSKDTMEVKRMYTQPEHRDKGIATIILTELEKWAKEMSYKKCV
ncbi:MAG: GNAT family N-acetyltransferase, partial [Ignavibacteriaceae bacterium]|nr:GNAT family N-acetyltransferase [Ignavibacteriaceae bacterium]